ncbi:MAG TPA: hypothetical protein VFE58_03490 [Tepidisphaeraceae bacterium]|jgi:hypothetical protein|nr:hypothetical protein [Tepidisphaeraceae bacterium]
MSRIWILLCLAAAAGCASHKVQPVPQDFFPIMTWELPPRSALIRDPHAGLGSIAECGFNTASFVRPEDLSECRRLGMHAIVYSEPLRVKWNAITDAQIEAYVRELIKGTANDPTVLGYFLKDEPGVGVFPALAKAVAAIKRLAPGKLAYINLFPDYATLGAPNLSQLGTASYTEYLEKYVAEVKPQFISYDNYRIQFSNDLASPAAAESYFHNLLAVRQVALEHGLPFWNIVSSNQIRNVTPPPSPANFLLQAYTTLAAGGRGVTWFTYYPGGYGYAPVDHQGHRTATWSYLRLVNDQVRMLGPIMAKLQNTGVYFTNSTPIAGLPHLPGKVVQKMESTAPMMAGEFTNPAGEQFVMLVNLSLEHSAKVHLSGHFSKDNLRRISPVDGSLIDLEKDGSLWLTAGEGALLRVQN